MRDVALEIERKFLVQGEPPTAGVTPQRLRQGYLAVGGDSEVRLRECDGGSLLTVKRGTGLSRQEVEIALPEADFTALWPMTAGMRLAKDRYAFPHGDVVVEVDVYLGTLRGLCTVEVEFGSVEKARRFQPPAWFGREVTGVPGYGNKELAVRGMPDGRQTESTSV